MRGRQAQPATCRRCGGDQVQPAAVPAADSPMEYVVNGLELVVVYQLGAPFRKVGTRVAASGAYLPLPAVGAAKYASCAVCSTDFSVLHADAWPLSPTPDTEKTTMPARMPRIA